MDVTHLGENDGSVTESDVFVSTAHHHDVLTEVSDGIVLSLSEVTFRPSERTRFHTHPTGQILYVTAGKGIVATETERQDVARGDAVYFPAGENHWHGATENDSMTHLSFLAYEGDSGIDEVGDDPVY